MKNKIWLLQIPIVIVFTLAFFLSDQVEKGNIQSHFIVEKVYPLLRSISGTFTNIKFRMRGPEKPKNKVVIVEIDSASLEAFGRWPWHRDITAHLIQSIIDSGARVVGLDMVFSEPDRRVPEQLGEILKQKNLGHLAAQFETDNAPKQVLSEDGNKIVMGWTTETACRPLQSSDGQCPVDEKTAREQLLPSMTKFAIQNLTLPPGADPMLSPLLSIPNMIPNIESYNAVGKTAGYFNAHPDPDGYIRKTALFMMAGGRAYPSLALEMARVGLNERIALEVDVSQRVKQLQWMNSGRLIPVTPLGSLEINFRGPGFSFPYVSAIEVLEKRPEDPLVYGMNRDLAASRDQLFKDAYVLIGLSALGVYDMRAFPFDSNVPGVEGHANILDNLLSADYLIPGSYGVGAGNVGIYLFMIFGALLIAHAAQRLESIAALVLFLAIFSGFALFDQKALFENGYNWNTSFAYVELITIFMFTLAVKYVIEERNKKFVKGAFSKYVAPAIVDSILKDPTKLTVGGQKKDLTILFSDIRGFTTLSEKMDAKQLSQFLNEYLGLMTDIVFEHNGTLDKYIGDAIMAFWGAPLDQPEHAWNACNAAIAMFKKLDETHDLFKQKYGVDVKIGVGINTGGVSVGNMGSDRIFSYTVIGDHVNLASRLEGVTKYYGARIVTTRFTFDEVTQSGKPVPPHRTLDLIKVKGKKNAVELIQILDRDLPKSGLDAFEKARALYSQKKWDDAIHLFEETSRMLALGGELDGPSQMYLERCREMKANPPSGDWDGSYEMTSK